jgi:hypothetical protein
MSAMASLGSNPGRQYEAGIRPSRQASNMSAEEFELALFIRVIYVTFTGIPAALGLIVKRK